MNTNMKELNLDEMTHVAAGRYLVPAGETVLPKTLVTAFRDSFKLMYKVVFFFDPDTIK